MKNFIPIAPRPQHTGTKRPLNMNNDEIYSKKQMTKYGIRNNTFPEHHALDAHVQEILAKIQSNEKITLSDIEIMIGALETVHDDEVEQQMIDSLKTIHDDHLLDILEYTGNDVGRMRNSLEQAKKNASSSAEENPKRDELLRQLDRILDKADELKELDSFNIGKNLNEFSGGKKRKTMRKKSTKKRKTMKKRKSMKNKRKNKRNNRRKTSKK